MEIAYSLWLLDAACRAWQIIIIQLPAGLDTNELLLTTKFHRLLLSVGTVTKTTEHTLAVTHKTPTALSFVHDKPSQHRMPVSAELDLQQVIIKQR